MTHLDNAAAPLVIERPPTRRTGPATLLGTIALVAWPIALAVASLIENAAPDSSVPGTDTGYFEAVAANPSTWTAASFVLLAASLFTIGAVPAVWRLSVAKAPVWAWVAAVLGALFAFGQAVHLMSWQVLVPALGDSGLSGEQAMSVMRGAEAQPFFVVIFLPFLIGFALAPIAFAVALWRGRVVPVWSPILALVAVVVGLVLGLDTVPTTLAFSALLIAALVPALIRLRRRTA